MMSHGSFFLLFLSVYLTSDWFPESSHPVHLHIHIPYWVCTVYLPALAVYWQCLYHDHPQSVYKSFFLSSFCKISLVFDWIQVICWVFIETVHDSCLETMPVEVSVWTVFQQLDGFVSVFNQAVWYASSICRHKWIHNLIFPFDQCIPKIHHFLDLGINSLLMMHIGHLTLLTESINKKLLVIKIVEISRSLKSKSYFWLYQIKEGISEILKFSQRGIEDYLHIRKQEPFKQLRLNI